ncbi:hypothetical protein ARMSODRAFT_612599 [Armillaria solidipes]|uniref:Uncharacterized protein n=1 Tax=Armillaria solidipes TaxID=1076256 RepID=A0A2H3BEB2_9AGAR|nr:hypothetical protein ARMSODRAFT_612599 [Armillaria solidipes]
MSYGAPLSDSQQITPIETTASFSTSSTTSGTSSSTSSNTTSFSTSVISSSIDTPPTTFETATSPL